MSLLFAKNISKTFYSSLDKKQGGIKVLDQVDFKVESGECVALIGESGSGKTTTVKIVAGLLLPSEGEIIYDGNILTERGCKKTARNTMQMVFQNPQGSFSPRMKLGKGIMEGLRYTSKLSRAEMEMKADAVMDRVGLPLSYKDKYVFEVSGGEAQRAAIARAIIGDPKLLLCDEITSALDVTVQNQIMELLRELKDEMHMAMLFISHDIKLVRSFCERIYVMKSGRIVEEGQIGHVFEAPQNEYTKTLIAASTLKNRLRRS